MFHIPKFKVTATAGSLEQLNTLTKYMSALCNTFEDFMVRETAQVIELVNDSVYTRLPSKETGSRSVRTDLLLLDECVLIAPEVYDSLLGQLAASSFGMLRGLTTPNLAARDKGKTKEMCDKYPDFVFTWTYLDCDWINNEWVIEQRSHMPRSVWEAEFLAVWGSATGSLYDRDEITISQIPRNDLPPRELWSNIRVGVDFGRVHKSAAVKGFMSPGIDRNGNECDILYIVDVKTWTHKDNIQPNKIIDGVLQFSHDAETVVAENEPFQLYEVDRLMAACKEINLPLKKSTFKFNKDMMVVAAQSRFNNYQVKIVDDLSEVITSITNMQYDKRGKVKKIKGDDAHDAFLHLLFSYENRSRRIEVFGPLYGW